MRKPIIEPRESCIGDGNCQAVAPKVFKLVDDGKANVLEIADYEAEADNIEQAISQCPVSIIRWQE
ncbi:ferredoxin [Patescibacteria group bacterium]